MCASSTITCIRSAEVLEIQRPFSDWFIGVRAVLFQHPSFNKALFGSPILNIHAALNTELSETESRGSGDYKTGGKAIRSRNKASSEKRHAAHKEMSAVSNSKASGEMSRYVVCD